MNRKLFFLLLLISNMFQPSFAKDAETFFKARIEHSEYLPAMDKEFAIGHKFDISKLKKLDNKTTLWFWIPRWRSGVFRRFYQTNFGNNNIFQIKSEVDSVWGYQKDNHGEVWQMFILPSYGIVKSKNYNEIKIFNIIKPIKVSNEEIEIYYRTYNLDIDNKTNIIIKNSIQEDYQFFEPNNKNAKKNRSIDCYCSSAYYSADGKKLDIQCSYSKEEIIRDFSPIDYYDGINLLSDFYNFLKEHNWSDLYKSQ